MKLAPITRIGAPLAKARSTAAVPMPTVRSAEPEITACSVSPPPDGAEDLEREPMLLEDAGTLADARSLRRPQSELADRDLEGFWFRRSCVSESRSSVS